MKFEYELNYDFVTEELAFKITKQPESLRSEGSIKTFEIDGHDVEICSECYPELGFSQIFIRGCSDSEDNRTDKSHYPIKRVITIAEALKLFQEWVENEYVDPDEKVEMTVAEIEEKLGIKNLKIVKE